MTPANQFVDHIVDLMSSSADIRIRKMFGGHGIFYRDVMIGLIADDTLYLKADDQSRSQFEDRGLPPFSYFRNNKMINLSYYQAPEELLEDREMMREWTKLAIEAALRNRKEQS